MCLQSQLKNITLHIVFIQTLFHLQHLYFQLMLLFFLFFRFSSATFASYFCKTQSYLTLFYVGKIKNSFSHVSIIHIRIKMATIKKIAKESGRWKQAIMLRVLSDLFFFFTTTFPVHRHKHAIFLFAFALHLIYAED